MPFASHKYMAHISSEKREQLIRTNLPLGYHPETGDEFFLHERDRYSGAYVLGVQGSGKSGLLENCIAYDCVAGNAVIVIDAHGDLTNNALAELPPHRLANAYLLDMEDEDHPFGVNIFATGKLTTSVAYAQAVNRIVHVFEVLWEEVLSQAYLPRYVRAATITLLANPGATLVDMYAFLLDQQFRSSLLRNVTDTTVRNFWQSQYDDLSHSEQMRRVQPLIGKLEALFMGRSLVRNICGQRQTTINFRRAIENRELIFIKLPVKTLDQDARLIGTIIMAQLYAAVFSFADVPEAQRPGVSVYIDEFQHFSTPDIASLFTEGRKFGVKLTVAHQYRGQLPNYLRDSTMTARTKICFQTTPDDGREMAHLFPVQETSIQPEDIDAHPVERLLTYGSDNYYVHEFIEHYLRPMLGYKHGNKVDIRDNQWNFDMKQTLFWGIRDGLQHEAVYVADPTPYLNQLLYQVMRTGNAALPIPVEVVLGFSNGGRGFFTEANKAKGDVRLTSGVQYPAHLVVNGRWTRQPESAQEQFLHFLFHLRMTMQFLATNPIGVQSQPSAAAVGQWLTHLPRRAAFVRSGEDVGVIYTHNTPARIAPTDFAARLQGIRAQTRQKYCHPRQEVERLFQPAPNGSVTSAPKPAVAAPLSRWEEA